MKHAVRILLADDHVLIAQGISKFLRSTFPNMEIVSDGRALLEKVKDQCPDLILMDIALPFLNGLEATRQIKEIAPNVKVVILTMHKDPQFVRDAFSAGASGYVLKESAGSELVLAIKAVLKGGSYVTKDIGKSWEEKPEKTDRFLPSTKEALPLTPRQREVLQLVAEGRTNKEIALILDLTLKTVEFHKARIMKALHLSNTAELTQYAITHRIVTL